MQKNTLFIVCLFTISPLFLSAQWTKTNGLPGGSTGNLLAYGDTVLAEVGNELYFSSNHGQTWSPMPGSNGINLYKGSTDGHTILGRKYTSTSVTLTLSDNFGQTWQAIPIPDTLQYYDAFLANGYVYIGDYHGLFRTNDLGVSWEKTSSESLYDAYFDGQHITAFGSGGLIQSSDGGFTWEVLLHPFGNMVGKLHHDNYLVVFMQTANTGCYVSSDYGQNWQHHTGVGFENFDGYVWHQNALFALDGDEIIRSTDLGDNWTTVPLPTESYYPASKGVSTGNALLIAGYYTDESSSILRSTDGGNSWFPAVFGITAGSGKIRSIGNDLYVASSGGLFQLNSDQLNWTETSLNYTPSPNNYYSGISDFVQSGDNWILSDGESPWVSLNHGASWYQSYLSNPNFSAYTVQLEAVGDKVWGWDSQANGYYDYFVSDNQGLTFQRSTSLATQHQISNYIISITQGKIYAVGIDKKIYRSDDAGSNWVAHAETVPMDSISFYDVNFIAEGNTMLISNQYSPYKYLLSYDGGQSWSYYNTSNSVLPWGNAEVNDLVQVGNFLIAATSTGVFLTQNAGASWTNWSDNLTQPNITNLEVHNGYLWAGTSGAGIWKRSLAELNLQPVSGKVFFDQNANAQQDPGEPSLDNVVVKSTTTNAYTNTRSDGAYSLLSNLGQEQLEVHPTKPYWIATPASQTVSVPATGIDFALQLNPAAKDLSVDLTNIAVLRPGFDAHYVLTWRNNIPVPATGVSLRLEYTPDLLEWLSATPAPTTQGGGVLTWDLGDVAASAVGNIVLKFVVPASDTLGTSICTTAAITPAASDLSPTDNSRQSCQTVVGSFDPNDKQAEPSGKITVAQLAEKQPITYTVRFQNTGNFPATFVRIADTLQQTFDPASFQLLSASHPCTWTLRGQGVVEFMFNNIQLPPVTTDEPGSHGFVRYSVQPRQDLPIGTALYNTAHIFFDYNAPVVTNTTATVVGLVRTTDLADGVSPLHLTPNPASHLVQVETGESQGELVVQDAAGRVVLRQMIDHTRSTFSVENFAQGLYQVTFRGEKTMQHNQLAVLH